MKIDRIIFSVNDDATYKQFAVPVADAWSKLAPVIIAYTSNQIKQYQEIESHPDFGGHHVFEYSPKDIPSGNLAKILRTVTACHFPFEYCLIVDCDIVPLNFDYFREGSERSNEGNIVFYTAELDGPDRGKFPICYMLAQGCIFERLVNPMQMPLEHLIQSWVGLGEMEDVSRTPFSDESLYRRLFTANGRFIEKIDLGRHHQDRRICRSNWIWNEEDLKAGKYIDAHLPRPLKENIEKIRPLFDYLKVHIPEFYE